MCENSLVYQCENMYFAETLSGHFRVNKKSEVRNPSLKDLTF